MVNQPATAAGGRLPLAWARSATVAQVVAIAAGILVMADTIGVRWAVASNTLPPGAVNPATWGPVRDWVVPAGPAVLAAIAALALRGGARWLRYLQIALWLLTLARMVEIAYFTSQLIGYRPMLPWLAAGTVPGVITIALLALSLRRPPGTRTAG